MLKKSLTIIIAASLSIVGSANAFANRQNTNDYCNPDKFTVAVQSSRMGIVSQPFNSSKVLNYSIPKVKKQGVYNANSWIIICGHGIENCMPRQDGGNTSMGAFTGDNKCMRINMLVPFSVQNVNEFNLLIGPAIGKWGKTAFKQFIINQQP